MPCPPVLHAVLRQLRIAALWRWADGGVVLAGDACACGALEWGLGSQAGASEELCGVSEPRPCVSAVLPANKGSPNRHTLRSSICLTVAAAPAVQCPLLLTVWPAVDGAVAARCDDGAGEASVKRLATA